MSDLELIENRLAALECEIEALNREKNELETAVRVIRRLSVTINGRESVQVSKEERSDVKLTVAEAARQILADGSQRHYAEIADLALKQGYQSRPGSTRERTCQTFWAIMKRHPDQFEAVGGGEFRLKKTKKPDCIKNSKDATSNTTDNNGVW